MSVTEHSPATGKARTSLERTSETELTITRRFKAPARLVFEAWANPEIFAKWWPLESYGMKIVSHEADVRTGGSYRIVMSHPAMEQPMAFYGNYLEVTPPSKLVWTNEEGGETGQITTVTFEEQGEETLVTVLETYPDKAALDEALESGSTGGWEPQFDQLEELLAKQA